jgi:hypothetical protein
MFASWSQSWELLKLSIRTFTRHKRLIIFPILSTASVLAVSVAFLQPFAELEQLDSWIASVWKSSEFGSSFSKYLVAGLFYFCAYFVIVFFKTALIATVLQVIDDGEASVTFGIKFAIKRISSIFGWALVSAFVGMLLKLIEENRKGGEFIAGFIGCTWTALTYFVIPIIITDGVSPLRAYKRSVKTMKGTWGAALAGNFSMGLITLLILAPAAALSFLLAGHLGAGFALLFSATLFLSCLAISSAIDGIFKSYLYAYATGKTLPLGASRNLMRKAFGTQ